MGTAFEERMSRTETAVKHVVKVQAKSVDTLQELQSTFAMQQTMLGKITRSLAPLLNLKGEMLDAMRDMFAQETIKQICDKRPGPPQRAMQTRTDGPCPNAVRTLPVEASGDVQQAQGPPSGVAGEVGYPMVDHTKGQKPAWAEDMQLDPDDSCLALRYKSAPYANVGPAMMGNVPAVDKITGFCDEE